jgi:hypothetical protein
MKFSFSFDIMDGCGVQEVKRELDETMEDFFRPKSYGEGLSALFGVLMCRQPDIKFKRRLRFLRDERVIYFDVMLDYDEMKRLSHVERKRHILDRFLQEIPAFLRKYRISDFDVDRFEADLAACAAELG